MTNKTKKILIGLGLLVLIILFLSVGKFAQAQIPGIPFGGRILSVTPCNNGIWIIVGPPRPGSFIITPATLTFPFRSFRPLAFVLGKALIAPIPWALGNVVIGTGFPVIMIGTSL